MSDKNELSWEDYEAITQYIYGALGEQDGVKVIGYGRNCKVKGKSGVIYQIDVLTEQSDGEKTHRTAIECKFLNEKVTNETVMKLQCIMEDAGIGSGIIVCKTGFTRDTLIYAEHKGIKLVELWEAGEKDEHFQKTVEIGILNLHINAVVSRGVATSIDIGDKIITIADEQELIDMHYVQFSDASGNTVILGEFLSEFSKELQNKGELLKSTTITYPLNRTLFYKQPNEEIAFDKIAITGYIAKIDKSSKRSFYLTDQVWMIMNELFDKRKLTLSKSGLIWNLP
ncbi:restriction endonuclease [Mucilaginibacter kameinonensis]|uniref:restriction endonuclease n=1 Tax=Mucilaginibacter kameinonensis TaxID=452286 RepID=UPI000EF7B241|nr:restriction endonuclease [Mucilaginibacter kameinonensis]